MLTHLTLQSNTFQQYLSPLELEIAQQVAQHLQKKKYYLPHQIMQKFQPVANQLLRPLIFEPQWKKLRLPLIPQVQRIIMITPFRLSGRHIQQGCSGSRRKDRVRRRFGGRRIEPSRGLRTCRLRDRNSAFAGSISPFRYRSSNRGNGRGLHCRYARNLLSLFRLHSPPCGCPMHRTSIVPLHCHRVNSCKKLRGARSHPAETMLKEAYYRYIKVTLPPIVFSSKNL